MRLEAIPELEQLSALDDISANYAKEFGSPPFNLSHWDSSEHTTRVLLPELQLPLLPSAAPYLYPYNLSGHSDVIERLGLSHPLKHCTFTPNGTSAILFAVWWLKAIGVSRIIVLCPSYFPVFHDC